MRIPLSVRTPRFAVLAGIGVVALLGAVLPQFTAAAAERHTYLVRLADPPLASYRGGTAGLAPTSPAVAKGKQLDVSSAASEAYLRHLSDRHDAVRRAIGGAIGRGVEPKFRYRYAYNGMALKLTKAEAATARRTKGVAAVNRQVTRKITTDAGPKWIGAPKIWSGDATGGRPGSKGEGVVVGVIDTGINHDHPSFADVGGDGYDHENPRDQFYGLCAAGDAALCNDKLIGVHDFTGTGPQDDNGHGSHTASTSAGNVVDAKVTAPTTTIERRISGVAPHANLITYKGCLPTGNCLSASLVMAIDQAVADGVDVINYSIGGGSNNPWEDDDALAFLGAREAGVFVATSAGNDGPGAETIGSPADSPWVLSVGASTHDRSFDATVADLSGGATTPPGDLVGKSFSAGYGPAPIVHASDFGDARCEKPFAPGTFDGEIVICDRGVNPRVEKGRNVEVGGAGGFVLVNTEAEGESTVADGHELPAVHLGFTAGKKLKDWVAQGEGHQATIVGTETNVSDANGDIMAGFSSRGPNEAVPGVIKPDVTAPGVDILAAVNTVNPAADPEYGLLSGTSMSSPHAAGAAALVRAVREDWTPAQVQSAMTSTGVTDLRDDDGESPTDPFDLGGGRIDLTKAARAGLVLDVPPADFTAADPASGGDPTKLNLATLGQPDCAGDCTWTRTVSNATGAAQRWTVQTSGPEGLELSVKPRKFRLAAGESVTLTVTADVSGATGNDWLFGAVVLDGKGVPAQRLPVAVVPGGAPVEVPITTDATSGSHQVSLTTPVRIKDFQATVYGLHQARVDQLQIPQDPTVLDPYDGLVGTEHVTVEVPEGARVLASEITETTSNDLDLFVGLDANGDGTPQAGEEICRSASEIATESCTLRSPGGGTYWVLVQNWLTGQAVDDVTLQTTVIPGQDAGNLTVTGPSHKVPAGSEIDLELAWNEPEMASGTVWLAVVRLGSEADHPGNVGTLLVRITRS